jgi:uroporphyrinogen-III synthase
MTQILVARREDEFSRILKAGGFSVINCPVIRTEPIMDLSGLEEAVLRLDRFDGIFITSAAAAEIFTQRALGRLGNYPGRIYVLGRRSFDILKEVGADVVFDQSVNSADEMLAANADDFRGKRFLFVRGERSLNTISKKLHGVAEIEEAVVYRTVDEAVTNDVKKAIREAASRGSITMVCFFSPSSVESFVKQFGTDMLRATRVAAIGNTTAGALRAAGQRVDVVSKEADGKCFAADVLEDLNAAAQRSLV